MAQALEEMPEVIRYVKNHNLGFTIPYTLNGEERQYIPDFIVCLDDGHGRDDLLNLLVEVSGEKKKDKAAKVSTARTLWVPAIACPACDRRRIIAAKEMLIMATETTNKKSWVQKTPGVCGGDACIRNTRITVHGLVHSAAKKVARMAGSWRNWWQRTRKEPGE